MNQQTRQLHNIVQIANVAEQVPRQTTTDSPTPVVATTYPVATAMPQAVAQPMPQAVAQPMAQVVEQPMAQAIAQPIASNEIPIAVAATVPNNYTLWNLSLCQCCKAQ